MFLGIENKDALWDAEGSGRKELERVVREVAESIVEDREPIPAKWMGLIERMENMEFYFTREEVEKLVEEFPGFDGSKEQKCEDAMEALRYFGNTGRLMLFEEEGGQCLVFMNPEKIVDFARMVTGPERTIRRRLKQNDAQLLCKGLVSKNGLDTLWDKYSYEEKEVMLDLLCRFDLLMRMLTETKESTHEGEMFAIPALLLSTARELRWARIEFDLVILTVS